MGALENVSHSLHTPDYSPLNATSPTYIFNEVHEFQERITCNIMIYPVCKDD